MFFLKPLVTHVWNTVGNPGNLPDYELTLRANELESSGLLQKICFLNISLAPQEPPGKMYASKVIPKKPVFGNAQHCQENNFATKCALLWRDVTVTSQCPNKVICAHTNLERAFIDH